MNYPAFFDSVPSIVLEDKLGGFLGAFEDDIVEISYLDCVKLSGHSCPTVASAYLMTLMALKELYASDELPSRSQIKVSIAQSKDNGVTGVIANVISYIVGASDEGGFKGIGGKMGRDNLIIYQDNTIDSTFALTRLDTGAKVQMSADTSVVPASLEMKPLMQKAIQGVATPEERVKFGALWQSRVEAMLLDSELHSQIIKITK